MNRIYSSFICHQNNTRNGSFKVFKNNFILSLAEIMIKKNLLVIEQETSKDITFQKNSNYHLKRIVPVEPVSYLTCLKLIKRKTDISNKKEILFSTSRGLLDNEQLLKAKIGGVPLFIINHK